MSIRTCWRDPKNLEQAGYDDILLVKGDGGFGYPPMSAYDRICVTAACIEIPPPLLEQPRVGGKLIAPVIQEGVQNVVALEKGEKNLTKASIVCQVLYVSLRGTYGTGAGDRGFFRV